MERRGVTFELNRQFVRLAQQEWVSRDEEWEFLCECSRANCQERVRLTVDAYIARYAKDRAVLAPGHRVGGAEKARRRAMELRSESAALKAEARHQAARTRKLRSA